MREHRQIVESWQQGSASTLATLVAVEGSSYRQPGARLIINTDGTHAGGISAGCLETDILRKAAWLTRDGAVVERYSTVFDEASEIPFGLGCGGVLDVLLEPVETLEGQAFLQALASTLDGHEHRVATWLPGKNRRLMRAIFLANGHLVFASSGISPEVLSDARKKSFLNETTASDGMFIERLIPPQRLYVFGAGDDAKPLVTMACLLGWNVTIVDGRRHLAQKARFPEGNATVVSAHVPDVGRMTSRDAAIIMTHSYEQDRHYLAALLPVRPGYLGLLGSRQRSALLIADVAAEIDWPLSKCCELVCAPAGLAIGGDGAEAIALAIIAEAQAACMGKREHTRKLSAEHVEHYLSTSGSRQFVPAQCGTSVG